MFGKVYFPRLVVPIAVVISNLLRFAIQAGLFVVLYLYFFVNGVQIAVNWAILLTPLFVDNNCKVYHHNNRKVYHPIRVLRYKIVARMSAV